MALKPKLIAAISLFVRISVVLFLILTGIFFSVPIYLNSVVIPEIDKKVKFRGFSAFSCQVRRIGFTGADAGGLRLDNAMSIDSIQLSYTLSGLFKKHIHRMVFSGVVFYCAYENGKLTIPGFNVKLSSQPSSQKSDKAAVSLADMTLPISVGKFEIRNAAIVCQYEGNEFRIPTALEVIPETRTIFQCNLHIYPRSQEITLSARADLKKNHMNLNLASDAFQVERLADITARIPGLVLSGNLDIKGNAKFQLMPFEVSSAILAAKFHSVNSAYQQFRLRKQPLYVNITGSQRKGWEISAGSVSLISPVPLQLADIKAMLSITPEAFRSSGTFTAGMEPSDSTSPGMLQVTKPFRFQGNFSAKLSNTGEWDARIKSEPCDADACQLNIGGWELMAKSPEFYISGSGTSEASQITSKITIPGLNAATESIKFEIPGVSVNTTLNREPDKPFALNSVIRISNGKASFPSLTLTGIYGEVPFKFPFNGSTKRKKVSVKSVKWDKWRLGTLDGTIWQQDSDLAFTAAHASRLIPELSLKGNGNIPVFPNAEKTDRETEIHFAASRSKTASPIDLERFASAAKGWKVNGDVDIIGDLHFGSSRKSSLHSTLNHGRIWQDEKKISAEGVHLEFSIPDLFVLRSNPRQLLTFEKAGIGSLVITNGNVEFQISSAKSFLIEKNSFNWCGGIVNSEALHILPGIHDYDLILHCDRLNLSDILEQFGIAKADGGGTVNGRIPVRFKNGKFSFHDGFLFSTPGDSGTIHVKGTEILTSGIPKNAPQYSQIELAREALKDFDYEWVKLRLTSEGEDLSLKMQFDGKPANPLPFVYKKDFGGFVRVESGSKGSHFQGIRLDLNLMLPLNEMLKYKEMFNNQ